jgi:3-keto-5-aminohexanoate cleavage enzyme
MDVDAPLIVAVAPNGARKTRDDHPALPMTADEIGLTAAACAEAGAAMIHLHVREDDGTHSLDADRYRDAIAAVRREAGPDMIVQVTSESAGIFAVEAQRAMVRAVRPEAVSLGIRELCPTEAEEPGFAALTSWMEAEGVAPQYILYDPSDVARYADLARRGVLATAAPFLLYVLGRYSATLTSDPAELLPFLRAAEQEKVTVPWAICAFGPKEAACGLAAAALGGHCRVGFENNLALANGDVAPDNAALVAQIADHVSLMGRRLAGASDARSILGMR